MKRNVFCMMILSVACFTSCTSRNNSEIEGELLIGEWDTSCTSCNNSEIEGELIGEWDAIKFAYSEDGINISDVVKIESAELVIPVAQTISECEFYDPEIGMRSSESWSLHCINGSCWLCSISGNSIKFTLCGTTKIGIPNPHEEWDIYWAFQHAYSFVIKGNELMIFFKGDDDDEKGFTSIAGIEKMNVIIFKKR